MTKREPKAPPGCTCDSSLPARRRCTTRSIRCAGALAHHRDPSMPPDEEETTAHSLAARLSALASMARAGRPITRAELELIAAAADFIEARAFALKRERLSAPA